jgi:hypothetical protein
MGRPTAVLVAVCAVLLGMGYAAAGTRASGGECPNERVRSESSLDQVTGRPYSQGLPECRAYEMVSPPFKQAHDANGVPAFGLAVSPDGETVGYASQGDFAEPENYRVFNSPVNTYTARREASGWATRSTFAPRTLVDSPFAVGLDGDFSGDLHSDHVSCGWSGAFAGSLEGTLAVCARQEDGGPWTTSPQFPTVDGTPVLAATGYLGGSGDLSRAFIQPATPLLEADTCRGCAGIYEFAGLGGDSAELRLVNVDNGGVILANGNPNAFSEGPLLGDTRPAPKVEGDDYHAISASGERVFFGATPTQAQLPAGKQLAQGEVQTVYARVACGGGASCSFVERGGEDLEGRETLELSNPSASECAACDQAATPREAVFQGASANGERVFFTTERQLLSGEDATLNLYEYDFGNPAGKKLVLMSAAPNPASEGAGVKGVVRSSSDGSHVYFVADGVLTSEENAAGEAARPGGANLYGYDTVDSKLKFVATLGTPDAALWGEAQTSRFLDLLVREAQTTPDGRYLVFSSETPLAGDTNPAANAVYRYDFETGELVWVSQAAPGLKAELNGSSPDEGDSAHLRPLDDSLGGALASADDWNRAISDNGEEIVFTTLERLQADDRDAKTDVYLWHDGIVSEISAAGSSAGAISASGADIVFTTRIQLVRQDTDELLDVYDARIGGGFPAPQPAPSCADERCQGPESPPPVFGPATSSLVPAEGALSPADSQPAPVAAAPAHGNATVPNKAPARAHKLATALKACKHKPKRKRAACESSARRNYGARKTTRGKGG